MNFLRRRPTPTTTRPEVTFMLTRAEALARKAELDAAHAWTPDERRELIETRRVRDEARKARDQAYGRFLAARRQGTPRAELAEIESALNEAEDVSEAAHTAAGATELRLDRARQSRRWAVKARHIREDDARNQARLKVRPRERVRVFEGSKVSEYAEGARR